MHKLSNVVINHWRFLFSLLIGTTIGVLTAFIWSLSFSTVFIIGWDCAIMTYLASVLLMHSKGTLTEHLSTANQNKVFIISLISIASFICVYAIARQTMIGKNYQDLQLALSITLTISTIFIAWLMIQVVFALQYAYLYFSSLKQSRDLPITFPQNILEPDMHQSLETNVEFIDFLYCAISIGTSGQTGDVSFTSTEGRKLAILHCIIAFAFNLTIISLLINIIATYL